jgi:hemerythrin-like domain-containing protein
MNEPTLPIQPLIVEHRLIERMLEVMRWRVADMESIGTADVTFIDAVVDFLRTYADRCHHGKEEDILFRELASKPVSTEHRKALDELVAEHVFARKTTERLVEARNLYAAGSVSALEEITACLHMFVEFYPKHIAKEEHGFFRALTGYFTAAELDRMLAAENEFDRRFIQVMYTKTVEGWERMPEDQEQQQVAPPA